jgi:hypothetical protein
MNSLDIIEESSILDAVDLRDILDLSEELHDTVEHTQVFRTRTEMEVSVLNDINFPTADSKYWQAMREQSVMYRELVMLSYEYKKNMVEISILERDMDKEQDPLRRDLLKLDIEKRKFILMYQARDAKDRIREIREWHEIKDSLKPNMKCSLTDCNEHQLVSYTVRWIEQFRKSGNTGSLSEKMNLISQLDMGIKTCKERGIIQKVYEYLDEESVRMLEGIDVLPS